MYVPKTERGKETVNRIITSSLELFAEKGFSSTSINDITEKAGVAHGLFYFYFRTKYDILDNIVKIVNLDMRKYLKLSTMGLDKRIEIEKVGMQKFLEWMKINRKYYRILIEAQVHKPESYTWYFETLSKRYSEELRKAMDEGQIIKVNPELLSYIFIGIGHMLGLRYVLWHNDGLTERDMRDLNLIIERMVSP
ncbi:TetR family transcriptional regulator [Candidatus Acidianus copahuensis]|uniref:TetR family transcriptional regulator n=3 Tax=Acidianus TaxID=12914 RepID=A0A031LS66_9CREN|nr:TetR family transcriptional regulator [Candidatus Acidianus copahuensis]